MIKLFIVEINIKLIKFNKIVNKTNINNKNK